jgi:hypothetical protein
MIIGRRAAEETLIGSATLKRGGGLAVYEENSRGDSLSPEMRSKGRGDQESTSSLKNVSMLALRNTILSMSTRTGKLGKGTLLSKIGAMGSGDVLTSRVRTKNTNGRIILGTDHGSKLLVNRKKLASRGHQINPSKPRIVIDEQNII